MNPSILEKLRDYADQHIVNFHQQRLQLLDEVCLDQLLHVDFYLLTAKNTPGYAAELLEAFLDSYLSSREEALFEVFLRDLAVYTAEIVYAGHKSTAPGVDLEFVNNGVHYVVAIKSGPDWGNSTQNDTLEDDLENAVAQVKQLEQGVNVQPVLGICYGKTMTRYLRGYMQVAGQNFWYLVSGNRNLYTEIIGPIGYRAREHNETFATEKGKAVNLLTKQFITRFCDSNGALDWRKLVECSSGNFDLDKFLP